ncbi:Nucleosome assembly protein (NAP) [Ceratobasidium sp. AG-Ba]|nr:Nucleosome assembly protein (NAP) [Ceratobasidium sp. AG-Ba]
MSNSGARDISGAGGTPQGKIAPTPVNTPLNSAPIQGLSRPTIPDTIDEDRMDEDDDVEEGKADPTAQAIFNLVQGRLAGLVGRSSGYVENLPPKVKRRVEALKAVQSKSIELEAQMKREILELEKKYLALATPIYDRRRVILSGESEPTDQEVEAGEAITAKEKEEEDEQEKELAAAVSKLTTKEKSSAPAESQDDDAKGVPQFWLTALRNHPQLQESITERDEEALQYLSDVRLSYLPEPDLGFTIKFVFDENPFFENKELEKSYYYQKELSYSGEYMYQRAKGTKIQWKEDKDLTKTIEIKKQRNKNTNRTRLVRRTQSVPSFFDFFTPPLPMSDDADLIASGEAVDGDDMTDEQIQELEAKLEVDYQVGEDLKERIIPRAVDYFTGKALQYDQDLSDFEDEDSEIDEDESEEDSDDAAPARRAPTGPKKKGETEKAEECKNQ